ncbi:MAG: DUF4065 domain-containing protein [Coriobacteriia bacterium]|nr:DUF4065 domain-containing protein [Coriobacteriia bacterium]
MSFCGECMRDTPTHVASRNETYRVKGEAVTIPARVRVCDVCGTDMLDIELDNQTLADAYAVYRSRHHLLQPDEIRAIRSMYGLAQKGFSKLLGWGEITLTRYESGSIQSTSHDQMLRLAQQPANVAQLLQRNGRKISNKQRQELDKRLSELSAPHEALLANEDPATYDADRPAVRKLEEMVVYFAAKPSMWRTKLNKLLYYADFLHYKRHGRSISGARYIHMQYGPVPADFYTLQATLIDQASLAEVPVEYCDCAGTIFEALRPVDGDVFDQNELSTLDHVSRLFAEMSAAEISEFSHREPGWRETKDRETIPYDYAQRLLID